jgi:NitT/TauT family transport system substrate-binding protein
LQGFLLQVEISKIVVDEADEPNALVDLLDAESFSRDSIRRNRAAFDAMVRATRRTLAWVAEHSVEEIADAVAPFYPDVRRDILTNSLRRYRDAGLWAHTPEVSRQGYIRLAESLKSGGFISRMHTYEDCVDQSLC